MFNDNNYLSHTAQSTTYYRHIHIYLTYGKYESYFTRITCSNT